MHKMMRHDRPEARGDRLPNVRLDEKNFRNVQQYNHLRSSWKEWKRQLLGAIRKCDVDFADFVETFERHEDPIDHIESYNPAQNQIFTNMYNRLISFTPGAAFQIV